MKAVKINMNDSNTSNTIKSVITGVLINALIVLGTTVILSVFLNLSGNLFEKFAGYLMLLPLILGGYLGGFFGARINKANGMIIGITTSVIVMIVILIISFSVYNTDITYMLLLKIISLILPGAIGGIKGVNKKEKFKV